MNKQKDLITKFYEAVVKQDEKALVTFFCEDAIIKWHCSNEQFTVNEYIKANCEYPGVWHFEMERFETSDSSLICVNRIWTNECSFHVCAFIQLKDDKISTLDEYWGDDSPAPLWRKNLNIGSSIK